MVEARGPAMQEAGILTEAVAPLGGQAQWRQIADDHRCDGNSPSTTMGEVRGLMVV